jgi:DNA primase
MKTKNQELFKLVIANVDIVQTISHYTPIKELQGTSSIYICRCPFNSLCGESFLVHQEHKNFFCFGCLSSGNVISFMAKIGGMQPDTAARFLSKINEIDIPPINTNVVGASIVVDDIKEIYE